MDRMRELYEKKGYPQEWIEKRMRGIAVRQDLTDEWQNRGAGSALEYAIQSRRPRTASIVSSLSASFSVGSTGMLPCVHTGSPIATVEMS